MAFWTKKSEVSSTSTTTIPAPPANADAREVGSNPVTAASTEITASKSVQQAAVESLLPRGSIRTAIGVGTSIQGKLSFDSPVQIDGKVKGEIFSSKNLIISKTAHVEAVVIAPSVLVAGRVEGEIRASERLEIKKGASVAGTVETTHLLLEEGGTLNARVSMGTKQEGLTDSIQKIMTTEESSSQTISVSAHAVSSKDEKITSGTHIH